MTNATDALRDVVDLLIGSARDDERNGLPDMSALTLQLRGRILATPAGSASGEELASLAIRMAGEAQRWHVRAEAAEAEAARLREDAVRYRWLRHDAGFAGWGLPRMPVSCPDNIANCKSPHTREISGAALDAAIDAAMGSANGQG